MVSHDRHMLEMTADRLVLVDHGTAREFDGSLDDYIAQVLAGDSKAEGKKANGKESRRAAAEAREAGQALRKRPRELEAEARSEGRRVGKECGSTCRSRWSPLH